MGNLNTFAALKEWIEYRLSNVKRDKTTIIPDSSSFEYFLKIILLTYALIFRL